MELRKRGYFPNKSNIFSNGACNMRNRTYSMSLQDKENLSRGRALVARQAHNLEVAGSIPAPAPIKRRWHMRGILITVISLVLVCSLSIQAVAAPLPGPPDSIGVGQSADQWKLNSTDTQATPSGTNSWSSTWTSFSSFPSVADVDLMFEGYYGDNSAAANFLGGQAYQFYWEGGFVGSSFASMNSSSAFLKSL